jgi:nucleotide-binding universal stress UspA family protein
VPDAKPTATPTVTPPPGDATARAELKAAGLTVPAETLRGDPVKLSLKACRAFKADVVTTATHGRIGTAAFWAGSFAVRVSARLDAAILLVPLAGTK